MSEGPSLPEGADWRLRAYRPGDEERLVEELERVCGRRLSEESWRWKLATRPSSVESSWLAVDRDGRPIFHYAGIPRRLRLPAGTFDAMIAVDLWTAAEHRRRGVFTRCAGWVHDRWRRAGVVGLLGLPNEQFGSRDRFLGWRPLFPLRWQIRALEPEAIAARRLGLPALARLRALGSAWNRLWDRRAPMPPGLEIAPLEAGERIEAWPDETRWGLERGEPWVRWRYLDCPRYPYRVLVARTADRVAGYLAYRIEETGGRRFGFVAELTAEGAVREALAAAAVERLAAAGAVAVATLAVPRTDLYRLWRRRGFLFSWGSFGVQCLPFSPEMDPDVLRDRRRWSLAGGDFDVI